MAICLSVIMLRLSVRYSVSLLSECCDWVYLCFSVCVFVSNSCPNVILIDNPQCLENLFGQMSYYLIKYHTIGSMLLLLACPNIMIIVSVKFHKHQSTIRQSHKCLSYWHAPISWQSFRSNIIQSSKCHSFRQLHKINLVKCHICWSNIVQLGKYHSFWPITMPWKSIWSNVILFNQISYNWPNAILIIMQKFHENHSVKCHGLSLSRPSVWSAN
jgi:hypothetical protein